MSKLKSIDEPSPADWDNAAKTVYGHLQHPADKVKQPSHYTQGGVEAIDYIRQQLGSGFRDYCAGNVYKYMHRYRHKGAPVDDLRKARVYLEWLITEECKR